MFHDVRQLSAHDEYSSAGGSIPTTSTFQLGSRPAGGISTMNVGGRYEFRNRDNWMVEGVGTCTATSIDGKQQQHADFVWDADAGVISKFALLTDITLQPSVLIEDSYFGHNRARGTLIKTSNVLVRNNVYNATADHCILAFPDGCYWLVSQSVSQSASQPVSQPVSQPASQSVSQSVSQQQPASYVQTCTL